MLALKKMLKEYWMTYDNLVERIKENTYTLKIIQNKFLNSIKNLGQRY